MLILTALTTIAIAVPNALGLFPGRGGGRPSIVGSVNRRPSDPRPEKHTIPGTVGSIQPVATCDAPAARHGRGSDRAHADAAHARRCEKDHGKSAGGNKNTHGGRPDDPGNKANKKQKPSGERVGGGGSPQGDGNTVEHGNGGGSGGSGSVGSGKVKEKGRTGNGGRSEHGNAG
jgi:hypothetical protein